MRLIRLGLCCALALAPLAGASAKVRIEVDLGAQTLRVSGAGPDRVFPVSTGRAGFATPRGSFRAQSLRKMHYSRKYHGSPMPHSIFFSGGYAIHGTYETGALGRPASHGCIRLSPRDAAELYGLVKGEGATIRITGTPPAAPRAASPRASAARRAAYGAGFPRGRDAAPAWGERDWSAGEGGLWDGW